MDRLPYVATELAAGYDAVGTLPVSVVLHDIRSLYNVGAFFRSADGVGIDRLVLSGITGQPPHKEITKTALGAEQQVAWDRCGDIAAYVQERQHLGYEIAAIETSQHAIDLFDWQAQFPVCLLFGHEVTGLDQQLLDRCDVHVRLPMRGLKHSLNVATAGGVVLYELLRKYRLAHQPSVR
ncbi:MAG: TrmH family RNA methyltransferase [Acidobacteriota bacterium]|nr:TrmH family RNA methyltransferase [Acidobacteriota bacterium]